MYNKTPFVIQIWSNRNLYFSIFIQWTLSLALTAYLFLFDSEFNQDYDYAIISFDYDEAPIVFEV